MNQVVHTNPWLAYRADVDGLRSVAVLSVLAYHAFPDEVQGGFIGVDVFFVLSGYLISSILFRQLEKGRFSYTAFLARRVRRILPALTLLMTATAAFGWFVLFPDELKQLGRQILAGNTFVANLALWSESGYFDTAAETKPLLHLWSLGVEEQFYLFWPFMLWLVWNKHHKLLGLTLLLAGASFASNLWAVHHYAAETAFYLPHNRFWELMAGGLLAYAALHQPTTPQPRASWLNGLAWTGAGLILCSLFIITPRSPFPGWIALLPVCGTTLLLLTPGAWLNRRVLAHPVPVYIGLISYPLYLWHWPALTFGKILHFDSDLEKVILLFLSGALAVFTFEKVEKRLRHNTHRSLIPGLLGTAVAFALLGLILAQGRVSPRNNSSEIEIALQYIHAPADPLLTDAIDSDLPGVDVKIKPAHATQVLFYGDSHAGQLAPRIFKLIEEDPTRTATAIFATRGGCAPIPNVFDAANPDCKESFHQAVQAYAFSEEIDAVVISFISRYFLPSENRPDSRNAYYFLQDGDRVPFREGGLELAWESLEHFLAKLTGKKPVFLVIDNPSGTRLHPKTWFSGSRLIGNVQFEPPPPPPYNPEQAAFANRMRALAKRVGAKTIDLAGELVTNGSVQLTAADGRPIFRDRNHLHPAFVREELDLLDVTVRGKLVQPVPKVKIPVSGHPSRKP
ncbi:MAG: acyltransferase family protein [Limisphaerales bacterium]